ncbi:hypothetical protein [Vulcanisaeta souniana]|uniref:hypothetical protein n=1 Tax=Vulcanisaeta souniana TaxID=164452 RepID=UPI000A7C80B3|nr:hypothetical protein [Vulcanisaeta souniana]
MGVGAISSDVATSLTNCLVNHLTVARGVTAMPSEGGVTVVVRESRVGGELYGNELVRAVLGLPTASLVASVVAESLNSPVVIETEEVRGGKDVVVKLRVVGGGP